MAYTNSQLLLSIKRRVLMPISQQTFEDNEILDLASEIIETDLLPKILQSRQEFYVTYTDLTLTKRSTDNFAWVRIPKRAVGQSIVTIKDTQDNSLDQSSYWVEGSKIYFGSVDSGTYRIYYHLRPGKLVEVSECALITDVTSNVITVSAFPTGFDTAGLKYDLIRGSAAFDSLNHSISRSAIDTGALTITFAASDVSSELAVGDYVTIEDETPIPQIPVEWFNYLAQLTAVQILESIGDHEAMKTAMTKLGRIEQNMLTLISPRIERKPKAIIRPFYDGPYGSST